MRVLVQVARAETNSLEKADYDLFLLADVVHAAAAQRHRHNLADGLPRVQGSVGVLKNDLGDTVETEIAHPAIAHLTLHLSLDERLAVEQHLSRCRLVQLCYDAAEGRLAASALADEADRFAWPDLEANPVHRPHDRVAGTGEHPRQDTRPNHEVLDYVTGFDQWNAILHHAISPGRVSDHDHPSCRWPAWSTQRERWPGPTVNKGTGPASQSERA